VALARACPKRAELCLKHWPWQLTTRIFKLGTGRARRRAAALSLKLPVPGTETRPGLGRVGT
jgi:hypothetical protein